MKVVIRESKQPVIDKYTVWIDTSVYGMSEDPFWPLGFNQYAGDTHEGLLKPMSNEAEQKLGKLVSIFDVPKDVRKAIFERI